MNLLVEELLNVDFDKHCRDCPYNKKDFSKMFNDYLDSVDFTNVLNNKNISDDLEQLQKHYTILLDFCYELMEKRMHDKESLDILKRSIYWKDDKIKNLTEKNEILDRQLYNIINLDRKGRKKNGVCDKT